jgi:ABC-type transporter lipoprotein component MlaA
MGGFFVLPVVAQTNARDFAASLVDDYFDPVNYVAGVPAGFAFTGVLALLKIYDGYDFIIATDEAALDSYETFKTMYLQNRSKEIEDHRLLFKSKAPAGGMYDFDME